MNIQDKIYKKLLGKQYIYNDKDSGKEVINIRLKRKGRQYELIINNLDDRIYTSAYKLKKKRTYGPSFYIKYKDSITSYTSGYYIMLILIHKRGDKSKNNKQDSLMEIHGQTYIYQDDFHNLNKITFKGRGLDKMITSGYNIARDLFILCRDLYEENYKRIDTRINTKKGEIK